MQDRYGSKWSRALPWILLARRTAFQPQLNTSPAELVLGQMPRLPGDLLETQGQRLTDLLEHLRTNAARPPVETAHHRKITPFMPKEAQEATHVYTRKGNPAPLAPLWEGPYEIKQRIGNSCLKIHVGNWSNGTPRHELAHWNNCFPAPLGADITPGVKPKRGRKPLNANAPEFVSLTTGSVES